MIHLYLPWTNVQPIVALKWYRSEEHTSELQSQSNLVCRLLLEKKNVLHQKDRLRAEVVRGINGRRRLRRLDGGPQSLQHDLEPRAATDFAVHPDTAVVLLIDVA